MTFVPPLILGAYYPNGFIVALRYTAVFVSIIAFILPSLMIYNLRKKPEISSPYRVWGGNVLFVTIFIIGAILVILPILSNFELLPSLGG